MGNPSANFHGNGTGNQTGGDSAAARIADYELNQLEQLVAPSAKTKSRASNSAPTLSPDTPFGITVIVGGTNVRFCISTPHSREPVIESITWMELKQRLNPQLVKLNLEFEHAKDLAFEELGKRLVDFVEDHFPPEAIPSFNNIRALNFSVAGPVDGQGLTATVTTTNTGINLKGEALAVGMIEAINAELVARQWPLMQHDVVHVLNDAVAGAYGEYHLGELKGVRVGVFLIVGTGIGGITLKEGKPRREFSEFGHTIISQTLDDGTKRYSILDGQNIFKQLDSSGNFVDLPKGQNYIENHLAGPWFAINFVRHYNRRAGDNEPDWKMLKALAEKIVRDMTEDARDKLKEQLVILKRLQDAHQTAETQSSDQPLEVDALKDANATEQVDLLDLLSDQLLIISELDWRKRQSWAVNSSSLVIKLINQFLLIPKESAVLAAFPCTEANEQWRVKEKAEKVLTVDAYKYWKSYFKDLGATLGALKREMKENDLSPDRIVLGGGIAEACQKHLTPEMKKIALDLIHEHGRLKAGTVVFSTMSPEAREAAITTLSVEEVPENINREEAWDA